MQTGKVINASQTKISIAYDPDDGLIRSQPNVKIEIKKIDPLLKPMIKKFEDVIGQRDFDKRNKKLDELYKRIPGLDKKITDLEKRLIKAAAEVELGTLKRGSYETIEEDLKKAKTDKIIVLTAMEEILAGQMKDKKAAIGSVVKIAREEYRPVIQEWDKILREIEELKVIEHRIRMAFQSATKIGEGNQYGYLPGVPKVNVNSGIWREDVKRFLK